MRIYLHAGMHKTGTTSLQNLLRAASPLLRNRGYGVLINPSQIMAKDPGKFDPEWLGSQATLAHQAKLDALIISAEVISTLNTEQLRSLCVPFRDHEVTVILCVRHWCGFLPSRWKQNCQRRDAQSFFSYFQRLRDTQARHIEANYARLLGNLSSAEPGEIRVVSYDNADSAASLTDILLRAMDVPPALASNLAARSMPAFKSRPVEYYDICRLFNGAVSMNEGRDPDELFSSILAAKKVDRFYDLQGRIAICSQQMPGLIEELRRLVSRTRRRVRLSPGDSLLVRWQEAAQECLSPYLVNPLEGELFHSPSESELACAAIEAKDLSQGLVDRMLEGLGLDLHSAF